MHPLDQVFEALPDPLPSLEGRFIKKLSPQLSVVHHLTIFPYRMTLDPLFVSRGP